MTDDTNTWESDSTVIQRRAALHPRIKISVFTDILDISVFINYSKFKYIFNLYIKIGLKVYEMKVFHFLSYRLGFLQILIIINDSNY